MTDTPNLGMTLIETGQTQRHVAVNEALMRLDAAAPAAVLSRALSAPPVAAADGDRYLVNAAAAGDWTGMEGRIAFFVNGGWDFLTPRDGWRLWIVDEAVELLHADGLWAARPFIINPIDSIGVNALADSYNRLAVKSEAALFSHDDVTPGSGDMRLTLNKAAPERTASLLIQDNWSGRAEIGLAGDDDLHLKVSGDGSTWRAAMVVDGATGEVSFPSGVAKGGLTDEQFGDGPLVTANYVASRGTGLFTNGSGLLGNAYPWPAPMTFDASVTPELPGAFVYRGRYPGAITANERIAVDPNRVYSVSAMVRQDEPPGDWSAYPNRGRHMQFIGMFSYDIDGNAILPLHHLRARVGGVDSKTVLTQPLGPGDTVAHVQSAAGWQDGVGLQANFYSLGIYEWRNSLGYRYSDYTRYVLTGAFAPSGVDKVDNRISLSMPLPEEMGNPDDPNGVWPVGTAVGGAQSGATFKYVAMSAVPPSDRWRRFGGYVGGVDRSGANQRWNFCPGTASISILVLPNYSLRSGGYGTYPDTGDQTAVRFAGFSVEAAPGAVHRPDAAGTGARDLFVMKGDPATGAVGYVLGHELSADDV